MPSEGSPSIATILSPARIPAASAGESSSGVITVSQPSRTPTSIPSPPKCPCVSIFSSR